MAKKKKEEEDPAPGGGATEAGDAAGSEGRDLREVLGFVLEGLAGECGGEARLKARATALRGQLGAAVARFEAALRSPAAAQEVAGVRAGTAALEKALRRVEGKVANLRAGKGMKPWHSKPKKVEKYLAELEPPAAALYETVERISRDAAPPAVDPEVEATFTGLLELVNPPAGLGRRGLAPKAQFQAAAHAHAAAAAFASAGAGTQAAEPGEPGEPGEPEQEATREGAEDDGAGAGEEEIGGPLAKAPPRKKPPRKLRPKKKKPKPKPEEGAPAGSSPEPSASASATSEDEGWGEDGAASAASGSDQSVLRERNGATRPPPGGEAKPPEEASGAATGGAVSLAGEIARERHLGGDVVYLLQQAAGRLEGPPEDVAAAVGHFKAAALKGSILAARHLGLLHLRGGFGAEPDPDPGLGHKWLAHAAARGDGPAALALARLLEAVPGNHLPAPNPVAAAAYFRVAAEQGDAEAAAEYALRLERGVDSQGRGPSLTADAEQAFAWYSRAAEQGCAWAENNRGRMLLEGRGQGPGGRADPAAAAAAFRRAAAAGSAAACNNLGVCLEDGLGVPADQAEADRHYQLAAAQGHGSGTLNLGYAELRRGNPAGAAALFARAVDLGCDAALYCSAFLKEFPAGPPADADDADPDAAAAGTGECRVGEAEALYRISAEGGDPRAQVRMAEICWSRGELDEALEFYHRAAGNGSPDAFFALGELARSGVAGGASPGGVERDLGVAEECLRHALRLGHPAALHALRDLEVALLRAEERDQLEPEPLEGVDV